MKQYYFFTLFIFLLTFSLKAQMIGFSSGFSYYGDLYIDTHYQAATGPGYKISLEMPVISRTTGRNYSRKMEWNENPNHFVSDGYQYTTLNVGIGKYLESFYFLGIVGISKETYYRNYYDTNEFYGNEGYYFQKRRTGYFPNYGVEVGLIYYGVLSGVSWTNYGGWTGTFGYLFYL